MPITSLNPYLNFNGTAAQAIALYERALGARLDAPPMRYDAMPGYEPTPETRDRVLHAMLHVGAGVIMVSDMMPDAAVPGVGNVQVTLHYDDPVEMARAYDALAEGGKASMPIHDAFWGAKFGELTDAFGISWLFTCPTPSA